MLKMDSVIDARPLTAPWHVMPKKPAEVPMAREGGEWCVLERRRNELCG